MRAAMLCHLFLAAAVAVAQPPPPIPPAADTARPAVVRTGDALTVPPGKFCDVTVEVPAGASVVWRFYPPPVQRADKLPPGRAIFAGEPGKVYVVTSVVVDFKKQSVTDTEFTVTFGGKVEPKPDDPLPPPKPKPDPKPEPPAEFKVILVYESGDTLTSAQTAVLYGKTVEDWMTANCTGGKAGWGRRDKDFDPAADTSGVKGVWAAAKPKVTSTPCIAIAAGPVITLEPFPATPAAAVELLTKYREGR